MDYLIKFKLDCKTRGYAARTVESYVGHIRYFLKQYDINSDVGIFECFLIHLRDDMGFSMSTVNHYFASLGAFYDYLEYERIVDHNPIPKFRRRYLRRYKKHHRPETRQLITIEQMIDLIHEADYLLYKTIIIFLAKTGIRRNELVTLDIGDIDFKSNIVMLKPTPKRSNRLIFFDNETKRFLKAYLKSRNDSNPALFVGRFSKIRIDEDRIYECVTRYAKRCGFHNSKGNLHEKFTPHCCRHWFTTWLRRSGMSREFIQELRGDSRDGAIDIYDHITLDELQQSYFKCIPQFHIRP